MFFKYQLHRFVYNTSSITVIFYVILNTAKEILFTNKEEYNRLNLHTCNGHQ